MASVAAALLLLSASAAIATTAAPAAGLPAIPDFPRLVARSAAILEPETACGRHSAAFLDAFDNFTLWAVQMYDSSVGTASGILYGSTYQLGHFDECLAVNALQFQGQYCMPQIRLLPREPQSLPQDAYSFTFDQQDSAWLKIQDAGDQRKLQRDLLYWALCVPSSCSPDQVLSAVNAALKIIGPNLGINASAKIDSTDCTIKEETILPRPSHITYMCVLAVLALLVVSCSYFDITSRQRDRLTDPEGQINVKKEIISAFSILRNYELLAMKHNKVKGLDGFHFLRAFFITGIVAGHRITLSFGHPVFNGEDLDKIYSNIFSMLLANGALLVDVFFTLGGFAAAYTVIGELEKSSGFSTLSKLIVKRYIRLTPSYLVVLLFEVCVLPYMGSGPFWKAAVIREQERCANYWWTNILYINNYFDVTNMCIYPCWYLSVDFQMFIVSIFLVYTIWKWPRVGWILTGAVTLASVLTPFLIIYFQHIDPIVKPFPRTFKDPREDLVFQTIYTSTYTRAAPYLIGMLSGILTHKGMSSAFKIPKISVWFVTVLSLTVGVVTVFSAYVFFIPGRPFDAIAAGAYGALSRPAIAAVVCSFIILQSFGHMAKIQKTFSTSICVILSRLTFGVYLIHAIPQSYDEGSLRVPRNVDWFTTIWMLSGDCSAVFFLAFLLFIGVEGPIRTLSKSFINM